MKILVIGIFISIAYFLELLVVCLFLCYASIMVILKISLVNSLTLRQCHYSCMDYRAGPLPINANI